jgi:hypothetical protein
MRSYTQSRRLHNSTANIRAQPAILTRPSLTLSHSPEQIWPPPGDPRAS